MSPSDAPSAFPTPEAVSVVTITSDIQLGTVSEEALATLQSVETMAVFAEAIAATVVGVEPDDVDILCVNLQSVCYPTGSARRLSGNEDDPVVVKFEVSVVAETVTAAQDSAAAEEAGGGAAPRESTTLSLDDVTSLRDAIIADVGEKVADIQDAVVASAPEALAGVTATFDTEAAQAAAAEEAIEALVGGTGAPTRVPTGPTSAPSPRLTRGSGTGNPEEEAASSSATVAAVLLTIGVAVSCATVIKITRKWNRDTKVRQRHRRISMEVREHLATRMLSRSTMQLAAGAKLFGLEDDEALRKGAAEVLAEAEAAVARASRRTPSAISIGGSEMPTASLNRAAARARRLSVARVNAAMLKRASDSEDGSGSEQGDEKKKEGCVPPSGNTFAANVNLVKKVRASARRSHKRGGEKARKRRHTMRAEKKARKESKVMLQQAFSRIDADGDGALEFEEFYHVALFDDKHDETDEQQIAEVRILFDLLDEDHSGTLEIGEISHALRHHHEVMEMAEHYDALHELVEVAMAQKRRRKTAKRRLSGGRGSSGLGISDADLAGLQKKYGAKGAKHVRGPPRSSLRGAATAVAAASRSSRHRHHRSHRSSHHHRGRSSRKKKHMRRRPTAQHMEPVEEVRRQVTSALDAAADEDAQKATQSANSFARRVAGGRATADADAFAEAATATGEADAFAAAAEDFGEDEDEDAMLFV